MTTWLASELRAQVPLVWPVALTFLFQKLQVR
jgi:hypothetical protein